jgi:predicted acetyltransferase
MGAVMLHPLAPDQFPVLERLWQLYRHDLSEFRGSMPDEDGRYTPGRVPDYREPDPDRAASLIRHDGRPAGFVLLRGLVSGPHLMAEFFVVRAARRRGVGEAAARAAFAAHPGSWAVPFQEENPAAARFWRRIVASVSRGSFSEQRRPVPDKPHLPPDVWLLFDMS